MKIKNLTLSLALALSTQSIASPWISTEEVELKHSIDLLVSYRLISRPVTQFPLLWQGIVQDLAVIETKNVPEPAQFALAHVRHALVQAKRHEYSSIKALYDSQPETLDGFGQRDAAKTSIESYSIITKKSISAKVQVNYTDNALDEKEINHYGSHLALLFGNWSLSAERINYWWGPANENALMLSNNAAPMQAIRLSRANSNYAGPSLFSFVGPWQLTAIKAKQRPNFTDTRSGDLWGLRLSSSPIKGLELAFSTVASDFVLEQPTLDKKPRVKQRLSSLDAKYSGSLFSIPLAVYAEAAGNNDSGILPDEASYTFGIEHFIGNQDYRIKSYIEYTDGVTDCKAQQPSFQCQFATEQGGGEYTQRQQWLGAAIGPQAKSITLASNYHRMSGVGGFVKLKYIDFEQLNTERSLIEVGYQQGLLKGLLKASVSAWRDEDTEGAVKLSWEYQF